MPKRITIALILISLLQAASAQNKLNFVEVDKTSYALFQQQKWNDLIEYSDEARDQGIDFFYLQIRTGIAYYNLKKYRVSSEWFLKAWENDQSFEWLQEYLYYSLVYAGRAGEAVKYAAHFTPQMQSKVGFKTSKLMRVALEAGYSFNPEFDNLKALDLGDEADVGDDYGEAYFLKNYHFESFDLNHRISPSFYINHNFTYVGSSREQQVDWGQRYSFPINIKQFQYFINPVFLVGKKLFVSTALSTLWGSTEYYIGDLDANEEAIFYAEKSNFSDFIFSSSVWSNFGNFSPGAEVNFANIYNKNFTQLSAWMTIYPFSNANIYFTPRVYFKSDSESSLSYNTFGISGGAQFGPVHFYGQYLNGDMENFIEGSGYVISNFPGISESKFLGSLYFPFAKKYQFVIRYISQDVTETYRVYTNLIESGSSKYSYTKHTLTAGISWKF